MYVYILKCVDDSYYTGVARDPQERVIRHNEGSGADYTKRRRPLKLVYLEKLENKQQAEQRERQIKKLSVKNKERLIQLGSGQGFPSPLEIQW